MSLIAPREELISDNSASQRCRPQLARLVGTLGAGTDAKGLFLIIPSLSSQFQKLLIPRAYEILFPQVVIALLV